MLTLTKLQENAMVKAYLDKANEFGGILGHIEHGPRHAKVTSDTGRALIAKLGYGETDMELTACSGFLHDLGFVTATPLPGLFQIGPENRLVVRVCAMADDRLRPLKRTQIPQIC